MNMIVLRMGAILTGFVAIYFVTLHYLSSKARFHKELVIALLYSAGIFLIPISELSAMPQGAGLLFFQLTLIALGNLLTFSYHEYELDQEAGFPSMLEIFPIHYHKAIIISFLILQAIFTFILMFLQYMAHVQLVFSLMIILLLLLVHSSEKVKNTQVFRILGDEIFLIPGLPVIANLLGYGL
jgi:4-hydroxybenzoate polyprenyltransferase